MSFVFCDLITPCRLNNNVMNFFIELVKAKSRDMTILLATPDDIPALVQLVNTAYRGEGQDAGWTNESHLIEGPRTSAEDLLGLMNEPDSVILKYVTGDGVIAGCVLLQIQGDQVYLGMLSVSPLLQGKGIGKAFLRAAEDFALSFGCSAVQMTVITLREDLLAWYERHGYKRTGELLPFHGGDKFGVQKQPLQLAVLRREVKS